MPRRIAKSHTGIMVLLRYPIPKLRKLPSELYKKDGLAN